MNENPFKKRTGTKYLTFKKALLSANKWSDDTNEESLVCHYQSKEGDFVALHFTTFDHQHVEIHPFASHMTEKIRIEISEIVHQIISLFHSIPIFSNEKNNKPLNFVLSDLFIEDFESYEIRQQLSYLFPYKKEMLQTYHYLNESCTEEQAYESKRKLVLFGKDGRVLSEFLELIDLAEIQYTQDDLMTIISFKNDDFHYRFHIHYFKQFFNDLGYTCQFLDNSSSQNMIHKRNFLRKGGIYDELQNHFTI